MKFIFNAAALFTLILLSFTSCSKSTSTDIEETGQQVGDVMASVDESGGSNGSLAALDLHDRAFARLSPDLPWEKVTDLVLPKAYATTCANASTFSSCASNTITRTFGGCSIGSASLSGTVTLTWGGTATNCLLSTTNDTITRSPSFTLTGRRGATLTVSKTGTNGQVLTWSSGSGTSKVFSFTNDGIRRAFTDSSGTVLFDFTTQTTQAITVTGTTRSSRTMSGGTLKVTNNKTGVTCNFSPSNVTWTSTCTCASSGTWSGDCSDGKSTSLTISSCGAGTLTVGSESQSFAFDRCYAL